MVERARACYKRKLDEDPSYKCLTRLQVGWAVAGAYPLRTPPRFVQVVNNHAQEILSIARPVRVSLIFIQRALCGFTRKINRLQPPRYSWLNNQPIGKQYDEELQVKATSKRLHSPEKTFAARLEYLGAARLGRARPGNARGAVDLP
jgi:hypothetical protein